MKAPSSLHKIYLLVVESDSHTRRFPKHYDVAMSITNQILVLNLAMRPRWIFAMDPEHMRTRTSHWSQQ
jgi:hypothetical protein